MNNIYITVTTQSGSIYELTSKDGKVFFRNGIKLSGVVIKFYDEIKIGGVLHIDFIKDGLFGTPDSSPMFLRTTPITDIRIVIR